jgi:hypothetical protein
VADEQAWSPLIVLEVLCGLDGEEAEVLSTSRMIPDMGLE